MIPKTIHYCWLSGDPFPPLIQNCIDSWKRLLPDYEIKQWNLSNFDLESHPWVKEAFIAKKYAFAADYIRCYALYNEGGIYLDSDVEVLKSFDPLIHLPYFIGRENDGEVEAAVMGAEKGNPLFKILLEYYDKRHFNVKGRFDTRPLPNIMWELMHRSFHVNSILDISEFTDTKSDLHILPYDLFSPKSYKTGVLQISPNTYTIHHFTASWHGRKERLYELVSKVIGDRGAKFCSKVYKAITKR